MIEIVSKNLQESGELAVSLKNGLPFALHLPAVAMGDGLLLVLWLDGKSEKTVVAYSRDLAKYYQVIEKPLAQMTLADLQVFAAQLARSGLQPSTRARTLFALKSILT